MSKLNLAWKCTLGTDMPQESPYSKHIGCLKVMLGIAIGFTGACLLGYLVFGPKGILFAVVTSAMFFSGQLFLKIFKS